MRIDPHDRIAGYPAKTIRKLMGELMRVTYADTEFIAMTLGINKTEAVRLRDALVAQGFLEENPHRHECWRTTVRGNALAQASAAKPLRRASADQRLCEFLRRVEDVARDPSWLYEVRIVVLFGSYLGSGERINDIDIAVDLVQRRGRDPDTFLARCDQRVDEARKSGRTFRTYFEEMDWPYREVKLFLKSKTRSLSLCSLIVNQEVVESGPHVTIWEDRHVVRGSVPALLDWPATDEAIHAPLGRSPRPRTPKGSRRG